MTAEDLLNNIPRVYTLSNGIRLLHQFIPYTRLVHCGYIINTGSRDETQVPIGTAHFVEHMLFKGTPNRKAFHILNSIDSVGGELNAFTSKEKTCVHASLNADYFEKALDVLTDVVFHSVFPEKEIEKERTVILEEIEMYLDNPEECIFETFDKQLFDGNPMAEPILGSADSLAAIHRQTLFEFTSSQYLVDHIVFSVVGNVSVERLMRLAKKYIEPIPLSQNPRPRPVPTYAKPAEITLKKPYQQANIILGGPAYPMRTNGYIELMLLNNYIGGPTMNNRLSLNIREKYGLAYNLYSFYSAYTDCGLWGVYVGCDVKTVPKLLKLIQRELTEIKNGAINSVVLSKIKKQYVGSLLMAMESLPSRMMGYGKDLLDFNKLVSLEEILDVIESVSVDKVQSVAATILEPSNLTTIIFEPDDDESKD